MSGDQKSNASTKVFNEPRIAITRVYTRTGDDGTTALVGGHRVPKDCPRIEAYGTVDELNAVVGLARETLRSAAATRESPSREKLERLTHTLLRIQHELFNLGSELATLPEALHPKQPRITPKEVDLLEQEMDEAQEELPNLRSFVLPGGHRANAELHLARTVCRRAERLVVALARTEPLSESAVIYLNRLSDALFVWSRLASSLLGEQETLWEPEHSASGLSKS